MARGAKVLKGSTAAATYNEADNTITITGTNAALESPSVLYENGIKGIEQVA